MRYISLLLTACLTVSGALKTSAQTWVVPDDQKAVTASFKFTADMQYQGEQIYLKNCQSCHGLPGKDNWARLTPPPGDLAKDKAQKQTDGELYYRITTGKSPMPEFRNILSEDERWHLIAFLRTFNPAYIQPEPGARANFTGRTIKLELAYNDAMQKIVVTATELTKESKVAPAAGVEVALFLKRYFGNLQIGDIRTTSGAGTVTFEFPADLPANRDGFVDLLARVNDPKGEMRTTPATASFALGKPNDRPSLIATRNWWSTRDKAPVWIIVVYTSAVLIVWGFIIYIVMSVLKIRTVKS